MDVVLAGSDYDDWKHVFPGLEPPRNLHIVGKGFPDNIVAKVINYLKGYNMKLIGYVPHYSAPIRYQLEAGFKYFNMLFINTKALSLSKLNLEIY